MKKLSILPLFLLAVSAASGAMFNWTVSLDDTITSSADPYYAYVYYVTAALPDNPSALPDQTLIDVWSTDDSFTSGDDTLLGGASSFTPGSTIASDGSGFYVVLSQGSASAPAAQGAMLSEFYSYSDAVLSGAATDPTSTLPFADPSKAHFFGNSANFNVIPEPATGALALVGVALLFKRRRAK